MLKVSAFQSLQPHNHNHNHNLHLSLLQTSKTQQDVAQLHALSIKTATFRHPSISSRLLALYTDPKINNLDYAQSVFDRIEEPTSFSWNTVIKCYVENHRSHEALVMFHELLCESAVIPNAFTLPCVIKGCARLRAVEEGKQIHGLVLKIGFGLDMYVQSSLVSMYSKCTDIDSAGKVFDRMADKDLVSWNSLVDGYARCGEIQTALKLFDEMPERDAFSWTVLVDGFSKCGKVEDARKIFDRMPSKNLVSWNAMINGYMKSGEFNSARQLFDCMEIRDVITWNSMISGYELNGHFMEAIELFRTMLNVGPMPSHATLVGALSAVSGLSLLSEGRWIHSYMVKNGFKMDGVLATLLIEMYSKCGSIESASTVFREIPKKKLGHWTTIIMGLGMHGMARDALELFIEMRRVGVRPHAVTFIGVLNACNHAGLVNDGRRYFDMMTNKYGIEPTVEHYGCLVDILCRAGHLEEAKNIIENMPMKPNKVIWMSLLSGSRNHKNIDIGEYAAKRVIEVAPKTIQCYVLLSNMYAAAGQWDKVSQVREMMKKRGIRKDPGCSSTEHKGLLHKFIVGDKSHPQTEEIYSKLSEMRDKLKCMGHVPDTTQVLLCIEGEKEKEAELENHSERLAIAFGLINVEPRRPIRIVKNLRVCNDCHMVTKLLSKIYDREIIVRDNSRFHHFKNGSCSCLDYW
uniref:DYW domain-containing protein n=1 Tax=Davidia involucrata TaxID=16924 RepID=A0A5B7BPA2_DAVIN